MTRLEDCCYRCGSCNAAVCTDNEVDCGHDDTPTCNSCCARLHGDERLRDALRGQLAHGLARWGSSGAA
jgi:hypothetical protein